MAYQVKTGYINPLGAKWAKTARELHEATEGYQGKVKLGDFDPKQFKNINEAQAKYSQQWIKVQQAKGNIETVHGSMVTNVAVSSPIKGIAKSNILKIGDVDVTPKFPKGIKTDAQKAKFGDELLEDYAYGYSVKGGFPKEADQSFKLGLTKTGKVKPESNKGMLLITTKGDEIIAKEKVFEVVMPKQAEETTLGKLSSLFRQPPKTRQLDVEMPEKAIKVGGMKFATPQYQRLSQYETAFAHQEWKPWSKVVADEKGLLPLTKAQQKLDTPAKARIMPQEGRHGKDTQRLYYLSKQKALDQIKGLRPDLGRKTDIKAEALKKAHPEIPWDKSTDLGKVQLVTGLEKTTTPLLDTSTRIVPSTITASRNVAPNILKPTLQPKDKQPLNIKTKISSRSSNILSTKPISSKIQSVSLSKSIAPISSKSITTSSVKSLYSNKSISISSKKQSSKKQTSKTNNILSSKPQSSGSKPQKKPSSSPIFSSSKPSSSSSSSSSRKPSQRLLKGENIKTTKGSKVGIFAGTSTSVSDRVVKDNKKRGIWWDDGRNTTDKKKGKQYKTHDFLGSMPLRSFEGMFKRSEIIHGDKRTDKMVLKDRKRKFKELKTRIF